MNFIPSHTVLILIRYCSIKYDECAADLERESTFSEVSVYRWITP